MNRDDRIVKKYVAGNTLRAIGRQFHLTGARVHQIVKAHGLVAEQGGRAIAKKEREKIRRDVADRARIAKTGLTVDEYRAVPAAVRRVFVAQRNNARKARVAWDLKLAEWLLAWEGLDFRRRGRRKGGLVLARKDKTKPFTFSNVHVTDFQRNLVETQRQYQQRIAAWKERYERETDSGSAR